MNSRTFEYTSKDTPFLKKDIKLRLLFTILFFAIFIWQFALLLISYKDESINVIKIVSTIAVMITSLFFTLISILFAFKSFNIYSRVKKYGRCVSSVAILHSLNNDSFIKIYRVINRLLTLLMTLVLVSVVTYSVLQIVYFESISYYLPLLLLIVLTGYNSAYHIDNEIVTIKSINEFNRIY